MMNKVVRYLVLAILAVIWFVPPPAAAQDATADAFMQYTNPHDICAYYAAQGYAIERETDNECMTRIGEGQYAVFTQYYYSSDQWCQKLTQEGQVVYSGCVPIPSSFPFHIDSENAPYVIAGGIFVVVMIISIAVSSAKSRARAQVVQADAEPQKDVADQEKSFNPKVKRSGRGSYGWEEMDTTTTEELNAKPPTGPGEGQSQGGIGLHQGEPLQPPAPSTASELEKLLKLKEKGALTEKEFNLAKKKLLG